MDNGDMSDVIKNLSGMLEGSNIPDNIKDILNSLQNSNNSTGSNDVSSNPLENSGIDMETILKISNIVNKMNSSQNDPRANLLLSLKPYLKDSRKSKVEQYVKLLNMSKVLEVINPTDNNSEKVK